MIRRRQKEDDYLGPSRGLAKLLHRSVMLLLWPLRHPLWFLCVLFIMFMVPTFMGVKPAEVHLWYWQHIKDMTAQVSVSVSDKTKEIMPNLPKVEMPSITVKSTAERAIPAAKVVDLPVQESRRKMFEKAKSAPIAIDIMKQQQESFVAVPSSEKSTGDTQPETKTEKNTETPRKKKLALVYVNEPKFVYGPAVVMNANEIVVNKESIILYGIYVDPHTQKGQEGRIFLEKAVAGQTVNCRIEAYTYQNVATAICMVNGTNINKLMVDNGYSKNVALE